MFSRLKEAGSIAYVRRGRWANIFGRYFTYLVYPVILIFSYIGRLIQILLYGLVGLIFSAMFGSRLKYSALVRLSAVAVTPIIIADAYLDLVPTGSAWTWGGILIAMVLLFFGVVVNRGGPEQPELAPLPTYVLPGQAGVQPPPGQASVPSTPTDIPPTQ